MADIPADSFLHFDLDPRGMPYQSTTQVSWPIPNDQSSSRPSSQSSASANFKRSTSPFDTIDSLYDQSFDPHAQQQQPFIPQWPISQPSLAFPFGDIYQQPFDSDYDVAYHPSPTDFLPAHSQLETALQMDGSYVPLGGQMNSMSLNWPQPYQNNLMGCYGSDSLPDLNLPMQNLANNSPTDTCLEARSLTSSSSDGWVGVDYHNPYQSMDAFQDPHTGSISNPEQTLHLRTFSDSSHSDAEQLSQYSGSSYIEISHAVGSPGSDSFGDLDFCNVDPREPIKSRPSPPAIITSTLPKPIPVKEKKPISPQRSPITIAMSSPTNRRQPRKNTSPKTTKTIIQRKTVQPPKAVLETTEKKVGRRKGPLRPDQRKQASEIRKLGACLRCKFLKKTCDKGEPCQGCLPSHARLWQVPCTRIDIKDIAYFMKDWKADYERHPSLDFPAENIKGYSESEKTFYVTHGYGYYFPVQAREVYVQDVRYFGSDWMEPKTKGPEAHHVNTMRFSAGLRGVSSAALSEYLDAHIEGRFEEFVDTYFEGTPFVTDMVKTVYRFWRREQTPVIRKSLKLLLAYNFTQHITMLVGKADEEILEGRVHDGNSKIRGEIIAPVMINFQVKTAMADMWRELQKDVLEELSQLYSSVYSKDKLKHWPTIFMVATILLTVWEEMQFDCHYRVLDPAVVNKFCYDMESTPVGVIVNLFLAISHQLPALSEWDTHKHRNLLNDNPAVNEALTEVRANVNRHDTYLRGRCNATFDRDDFDSLSNKFTSKLVIRAN
ncbi:MAG: hypothetical protein L6R38_007276 [Xanthoria sp. 2 TBL-2021]|nr:MAG: hypothetical protein L6R38_007276 [Xanthoria sp. 2 TBL-2021]